jgi:hypothetical protein
MTDRTVQIAPREGQALGRSETGRIGSPLTVFDRFADEVERVFDDFGVGRGWFGPRWGRSWSAAPLPEGAITDQAKASFHDGVLEVTLPAPPQLTRGRRLEIKEGAEQKK